MTERTSVVVVGGGPVGLSMALLLDRFGVGCLLAERNPTTSDHPKARGCNSRTMELFRQWGLERHVRARGLSEGSDAAIVVESLAGDELGRVLPEPPDRVNTPAWTCHVTQDVVEEELHRAVERCKHVRMHFDTEVVGVRHVAEGVEVDVVGPDGVSQTWLADYVVAADGAGSPTRHALGIRMVGPATLAVWANDFWIGDIADHLGDRETVSYIVVPDDPDAPTSMLFASDRRGRYLTWTQLGGDDDVDVSAWTEDRVRATIRQQIGADVEVELLGQAVWRMSSQLAEQFRDERVFLVGDAAHRFPPTGGIGMNTGIQDAHNLAWKLAFVLDGTAGAELLDTYEQERRPVAQSNADWSVGNASRISELVAGVRSRDRDRIAFWLRDMEHHIHQTGRALGFTYEEGALIPDGTQALPLDSRQYRPSDRPGGRFPHAWLDLSRQESTLDWFDRELTLVAGAHGEPWLDAGAAVAVELGIPIRLRSLPCSSDDVFGMGARGATLVRPDGHVAWRTPWVPEDATAVLAAAVREILRR